MHGCVGHVYCFFSTSCAPHALQMLSVAGWESSKHNMGMAFNRNFWSKMQSCADTFCGYDDYNWDWSVEATLSDCRAFRGSSQTAALVLGGARV